MIKVCNVDDGRMSVKDWWNNADWKKELKEEVLLSATLSTTEHTWTGHEQNLTFIGDGLEYNHRV